MAANTIGSYASAAARALAETYEVFTAALDTARVDSGLSQLLAEIFKKAEFSEEAVSSPTLLPLLACEVAGGEAREALPVAAAWRGLHIASKVIDDVEDGDAVRMGGAGSLAHLVNVATGLYAASTLCLSSLPDAVYRDLVPAFQHTILEMAGGQHREFHSGEGESTDACLQTIGIKAGSFFALAARSGARCATTDTIRLNSMQDFGYNVGIMLQLTNDLSGFRECGASGDLANGRRKLPVIYALSVASPSEQARLELLLANAATDRETKLEARRLMSALGAEAYLGVEISRYRRRALMALDGTGGSTEALGRLRDWLSFVHRGAI